MGKSKTYEYPVNALHSTVLGWDASRSAIGREYWGELDWRLGYWVDHSFRGDWEYLHVYVKHDSQLDGPDANRKGDRRVYWVRCKHHIGSKWRGGYVQRVRCVTAGDGYKWAVEVGPNDPLGEGE